MQKNILAALDNTTHELQQTIQLFTQEQFNQVPFEGSWTAAQVVDHVLKSESGLTTLLKGNIEITNRNPEENIPAIEGIFLDFSTKMKSPEFILPSAAAQDKATLINSFETNRNNIKELAGNIDLTVTCTDFPFPGFGTLTGLEWISFITCHSKRHTHQLKNIYQQLQ